MSDEEFKK